jgi:hypothetical protein
MFLACVKCIRESISHSGTLKETCWIQWESKIFKQLEGRRDQHERRSVTVRKITYIKLDTYAWKG